MNEYAPVRFFFGANTPNSFFGFHQSDLYDPRDGWIAYLIKSGAGTGKATFMRRVYDTLTTMGLDGEAIYCSSDPSSLDAVVFPQIKLCVMDATSPHIVEPFAYGECEQLIPFGCCLRVDQAAQNTADWFEATDACTACHTRCCRYLAAAHSLLTDAKVQLQSGIDREKMTASAMRIARREWGAATTKRGKETRRLLSAITPEGAVFFADTAAALCPRLYVIEDDYGVIANDYLRLLTKTALSAGHNVITAFCPLSPQEKQEHLLIPSLGVGFLTSNRFHTVEMPVYRRIHASRFIDPAVWRHHRQQCRFDLKAAKDILQAAVDSASEAKQHHDRMEERHIAVMDWELWQTLADRAEAEICRIALRRLS